MNEELKNLKLTKKNKRILRLYLLEAMNLERNFIGDILIEKFQFEGYKDDWTIDGHNKALVKSAADKIDFCYDMMRELDLWEE